MLVLLKDWQYGKIALMRKSRSISRRKYGLTISKPFAAAVLLWNSHFESMVLDLAPKVATAIQHGMLTVEGIEALTLIMGENT